MAFVKLILVLAFACLAWSGRPELRGVVHRRVSSVTRISDGNGTALAEVDVEVDIWATSNRTNQTTDISQVIQRQLLNLKNLDDEPQLSSIQKNGLPLQANVSVWEDVVVSAPKQANAEVAVSVLVWAQNKKHRDELLSSIAGRM